MTLKRFADWKVEDAWARLSSAGTPEGREIWARRFVAAKFERGDYAMLQILDEATHAALTKAELERWAASRST